MELRRLPAACRVGQHEFVAFLQGCYEARQFVAMEFRTGDVAVAVAIVVVLAQQGSPAGAQAPDRGAPPAGGLRQSFSQARRRGLLCRVERARLGCDPGEGSVLALDGLLALGEEACASVGRQALANQENSQRRGDQDDHERHDKRVAVAAGDEPDEILLRHRDEDQPVLSRRDERRRGDNIILPLKVDHVAPRPIGAELIKCPGQGRIAQLFDLGGGCAGIRLVGHDAAGRRGNQPARLVDDHGPAVSADLERG